MYIRAVWFERYTIQWRVNMTLFNRRAGSDAFRADNADAQADLELHCPHMIEDPSFLTYVSISFLRPQCTPALHGRTRAKIALSEMCGSCFCTSLALWSKRSNCIFVAFSLRSTIFSHFNFKPRFVRRVSIYTNKCQLLDNLINVGSASLINAKFNRKWRKGL